MPRLTQWMLRVAVVYLLVGFSLGVVLLLARVQWIDASWWRLYPVHIECVTLGWMLHLALGVAYWIFPRIDRVKRPLSSLAWTSFALLNIGIVATCLHALGVGLSQGWLLARLLETLAFLLFGFHLWPRIKRFDSAS